MPVVFPPGSRPLVCIPSLRVSLFHRLRPTATSNLFQAAKADTVRGVPVPAGTVAYDMSLESANESEQSILASLDKRDTLLSSLGYE